MHSDSLRKQLTFCKVVKERKFPHSTTNQKHYQDLGSARHQYGISALVTQRSFCEGSSGDLVKRRLFSQASTVIMILIMVMIMIMMIIIIIIIIIIIHIIMIIATIELDKRKPCCECYM